MENKHNVAANQEQCAVRAPTSGLEDHLSDFLWMIFALGREAEAVGALSQRVKNFLPPAVPSIGSGF
jgi:hypothetical protein